MGQTLSEPVVDKVIRTLHHPAPAPAVCSLPPAHARLQSTSPLRISPIGIPKLTSLCHPEIRKRRWRLTHLRHLVDAGLADQHGRRPRMSARPQGHHRGQQAHRGRQATRFLRCLRRPRRRQGGHLHGRAPAPHHNKTRSLQVGRP